MFKTVGSLSGGEQSWLRLCMLMDEKINLLILDEPTNHLDIASREWVECAIEEFEGVLLFVSHDRYFVEKIRRPDLGAGGGRIRDFKCGYAKYRSILAHEAASALAPAAVPERREAEKRRSPDPKTRSWRSGSAVWSGRLKSRKSCWLVWRSRWLPLLPITRSCPTSWRRKSGGRCAVRFDGAVGVCGRFIG